MKLRLTPLRLLLVVGITMIVTIVAINLLSGPEKELSQRIEHRYAITDPQFARFGTK